MLRVKHCLIINKVENSVPLDKRAKERIVWERMLLHGFAVVRCGERKFYFD